MEMVFYMLCVHTPMVPYYPP